MRVEVDAQCLPLGLDEQANCHMTRLTSRVIGAAITVHKALGPGFIESIYEKAVCIELAHQGLSFERQVGVAVFFREVELGFHRLDLLVEGELIVELKAIRSLEDAHFSTVRSYLRAFGLRDALILNFAKSTLEIRRIDAARKRKASALSPFRASASGSGIGGTR